VALIAVLPLVALLVFVVRAARYDLDRDARSWAAAYGVILTPTNIDFVRTHLRTGRRLRFVCSIAGLLLPPLVSRAVDPRSGSSGSFVGLFVGYMVGSVWAELSVTRSATDPVRVATLAPRRLEEYLPGRLRWGLWVVAGTTFALSLASLAIHQPDLPTYSYDGPAAPVIGGAALAIAAAVELTQRWILRRAQPFVSPDLVTADDAARSSSIHALAGSGLCCALFLLIAPAIVLANADVQILRATMPLLAFASFIAALISIRYYVYRAWRVRRPVPPLAVG